jgi:hypothetical protein
VFEAIAFRIAAFIPLTYNGSKSSNVRVSQALSQLDIFVSEGSRCANTPDQKEQEPQQLRQPWLTKQLQQE